MGGEFPAPAPVPSSLRCAFTGTEIANVSASAKTAAANNETLVRYIFLHPYRSEGSITWSQLRRPADRQSINVALCFR